MELGYLDSARVQVDRTYTDIGAELICPICQNILWKPVTCSQCENSFCGGCIRTWLGTNTRAGNKPCPFNCEYRERRPPPILSNLLSKLQVSCAYTPNGCQTLLPYDGIVTHEQTCTYEQVPCSICQLPVSDRDESDRHKLRQCFQTMHDKGPDHVQKQFMKLLETIEDNQRRIEALEAAMQ